MTQEACERLTLSGFWLVYCSAMGAAMLPVSRWAWLAAPVFLYLLLPVALLGLLLIAWARPAARERPHAAARAARHRRAVSSAARI